MNVDFDLSVISKIASSIIKSVNTKKLLFYGSMGVGKTTLIKEICKQLGVKDVITSPTFSLVNEYRNDKNESIYHFDFYRIESEEEAYNIGIEDYFDSNSWCLIEWPERIENLLPLEASIIKIKVLDNEKRNIQLNQL